MISAELGRKYGKAFLETNRHTGIPYRVRTLPTVMLGFLTKTASFNAFLMFIATGFHS